MEKFMLFFRGSEAYQQSQPAEVLQSLKEKMINWVTELIERGVHLSSEPLTQAGKQVDGAKKTVINVPFGEEREVIGGCTIVQAKDMNEAVEIAKSCPILETNANIEIRPVQTI